MPVLTRSQAIVKQPLAHVASSRASRLGGSQPHHQGFLNNLSWKEVSSTVIGHLDLVLLLWLWGLRGLRHFKPAEQIA